MGQDREDNRKRITMKQELNEMRMLNKIYIVLKKNTDSTDFLKSVGVPESLILGIKKSIDIDVKKWSQVIKEDLKS